MSEIISTSFREKPKTGGLITLSLQKLSVRGNMRGPKGKTLVRVIMRCRLARGYRCAGRVNLLLSEQAVAADNDALSVCEQKLTECEKK